jgi:hypothetical protein
MKQQNLSEQKSNDRNENYRKGKTTKTKEDLKQQK